LTAIFAQAVPLSLSPRGGTMNALASSQVAVGWPLKPLQ
jgi:hypothetical protein